MIIPTKRLLLALLGLTMIAFIAIFWSLAELLWLYSIGIVGSFVLIDALLVYRPHRLRITRDISASLSLGVKQTVRLRIYNDSSRTYQLVLYDHYPLALKGKGLPIYFGLTGNQKIDLKYQVRALKRGKIKFEWTQIYLLSSLGFWQRNIRIKVDSLIHVYPNFSAVAQYALMATDNRLSQMGIIKKRRRGEGQDFHQLREYQKSDSLRQIDWKASSRMRKVISREYQDERDQEVIFLLDCGHRMQAKDGELSHFDHTLNAILLLSYVALKQGDAVGLVSFGGVSRWAATRKGQHMIQVILNTIYDLEPTNDSPDYSQIATELMVQQKKRALVILVTNLRDEDSDDLLPALKLLRKKHLLLVASMREKAIDDVTNKPITHYDDALLNSAVQHYMQQRSHMLDRIKQANIIGLDVTPENLSVSLINSYLDIKSSGRL